MSRQLQLTKVEEFGQSFYNIMDTDTPTVKIEILKFVRAFCSEFNGVALKFFKIVCVFFSSYNKYIPCYVICFVQQCRLHLNLFFTYFVCLTFTVVVVFNLYVISFIRCLLLCLFFVFPFLYF